MGISKNVSSAKIPRVAKMEQGFSMPELLIVLLVGAILTVIAVPNGIRQMQLYRLETSVSIVSNKLMEARMNAIKRNRTTSIKIDKTKRTAQIRSTNDMYQPIDVGFPERLSSGLVLDSLNSVEVNFDSMGRFSTGTQTITLKESNSNKRKDITISPSGKVSVGQMY